MREVQKDCQTDRVFNKDSCTAYQNCLVEQLCGVVYERCGEVGGVVGGGADNERGVEGLSDRQRV